MNDLYAMRPSQIVMYLTEYCPDCRRAKDFFEAYEIEYLNVDIEGDEAAAEFVANINNGNRSVPTIIFPDGSILVEPSLTDLRNKFAKEA